MAKTTNSVSELKITNVSINLLNSGDWIEVRFKLEQTYQWLSFGLKYGNILLDCENKPFVSCDCNGRIKLDTEQVKDAEKVTKKVFQLFKKFDILTNRIPAILESIPGYFDQDIDYRHAIAKRDLELKLIEMEERAQRLREDIEANRVNIVQ